MAAPGVREDKGVNEVILEGRKRVIWSGDNLRGDMIQNIRASRIKIIRERDSEIRIFIRCAFPIHNAATSQDDDTKEPICQGR